MNRECPDQVARNARLALSQFRARMSQCSFLHVAVYLALWVTFFSRRHLVFSYFSQETGFDISGKLSPMETICMKFQILFPGKNNINLSAEFAQKVRKVNYVAVRCNRIRLVYF